MFGALCLVCGVVVTSCLLYDLGVGCSVSELLRHFQCPVSYTPAIAVTVRHTYNVTLRCVSVGSIHYLHWPTSAVSSLPSSQQSIGLAVHGFIILPYILYDPLIPMSFDFI
jgi:hypothetical protein